jgi:PPM family protein phosphatase
VISDKFALMLLADGLGGHRGGALAAQRCVDTIATAFCKAPGLSDAILNALVEEADQAVATLWREQRKSSDSMRTTLALLAICGSEARWAHVGDSRIYRFRGNVLMQRTRDHTVSELVMGLPDKTLAAPPDEADRHVLLRAVGAGEGCRAELSQQTITLQVGDAFLLCSDGLWSLVSDPEIIDCLSKAASPLEWSLSLEQRLQEHLTCLTAEEQDNCSLIAVMVMP